MSPKRDESSNRSAGTLWGMRTLGSVLLAAALLAPVSGSAQAADGYRTSDYRWSTCQPIHFLVNLSGTDHHRKTVQDVRTAIRRIAAQTGMPIRYAGTTRSAVESPSQPEGTVIVGFRTPAASPALRAGQGGTTTGFAWPVRSGRNEWSRASVVINSRVHYRYGTGRAGNGRGPLLRVLMHEFGHVVGLDHLRDKGEIMHVDNIDVGTTWGPGDRAGLARVGAQSRCTASSVRR